MFHGLDVERGSWKLVSGAEGLSVGSHLYLSVGLGRPLEGLSPWDRARTFRRAPTGSCLEENCRSKEGGLEAGSRQGRSLWPRAWGRLW